MKNKELLDVLTNATEFDIKGRNFYRARHNEECEFFKYGKGQINTLKNLFICKDKLKKSSIVHKIAKYEDIETGDVYILCQSSFGDMTIKTSLTNEILNEKHSDISNFIHHLLESHTNEIKCSVIDEMSLIDDRNYMFTALTNKYGNPMEMEEMQNHPYGYNFYSILMKWLNRR